MSSSPAFHGNDAMGPPREMRLSAAASANKGMVVALSAIGVLLLLPLGGITGAALSRSSGILAVLGPLVISILGVALLVAVVWGLLSVFRRGAHLHGTELVVREAFRTRRVDLATAQLLRLTNSNSGWSARDLVPTLDAHTDAQHRSVTVHFPGARQGHLPAPEVEALVAAIRVGERTGPAAQHAENTIRQLYLRAYAPSR